jgi:hypothetical protein
MIHLFSQYVPRRLIVLAGLEELVLLIAAYVGISLRLSPLIPLMIHADRGRLPGREKPA